MKNLITAILTVTLLTGKVEAIESNKIVP